MAVRIRMKKTGGKNKPCFRIVVADARAQRDGNIIENIGYYDPRHQDEKIDVARAEYWITRGAQPSEIVNDVILRAKGIPKPEKEYKKKEVAALVVEAKKEEQEAAQA